MEIIHAKDAQAKYISVVETREVASIKLVNDKIIAADSKMDKIASFLQVLNISMPLIC
jgi:hypothetical protein